MRLKAALCIAACTAIAIAAAPLVVISSRGVASASPTPGSAASDVPAGANLLSNGDFATGSGKSPDHWRTGGWNESPTVTSYDWLHAPDSEPELIVNNLQANDARWLQTLSLAPGWYYVSAEARTEDVPASAAGASISLDEDSINSLDLHGVADWRRLSLYLKVGAHGADVDIALRLGGFGSLNTGRAFFRRARVVKLDAPPANAAPVFDLAAVRRSLVAPPVGKPWTLVAVFVLLAITAVIGWRIYGVEDLAPAPTKTPPPRPATRSERRRRQGGTGRPRR